MTRPVGTFCLVLHTHLPWLAHHGAWPVGEEWLHQAWATSYLPVVDVLDRLAAEGRTHLLTLGFIVLLIVLVLEKVFTLSRSRLFGWFFWLYNAGVILTSGMLIWHGILTVLGEESSKMIAGIAGTGHILLAAGMVLLFLALGRALKRERAGALIAAEPLAVAAS